MPYSGSTKDDITMASMFINTNWEAANSDLSARKGINTVCSDPHREASKLVCSQSI